VTVELRQLRCFVAAADELSFSAAARKLFVSQQSLSRTIAQLERQLGVRLFERTTRAVSLTASGHALLPEARQLLAASERAIQVARRAGGDPGPPLRVDISSGGIETGALILRRLRSDEPDIAIEQREIGVRRGIAELQAGGLDLLLGHAGGCPPDLRAELVRCEPTLVGMAGAHPLAALERVPVAALADVELLLPSDEAAGEWNEFVERFCRDAGVTPRRFRGITHGSVSAAEIVRESGCVVPTMAWTEPPAGIEFRPLIDPTPHFAWSLMWRPGDDMRREITAIRQAAKHVAKERRWLTTSP
jgi:DNA-binding transcriptional LysR family regulator